MTVAIETYQPTRRRDSAILWVHGPVIKMAGLGVDLSTITGVRGQYLVPSSSSSSASPPPLPRSPLLFLSLPTPSFCSSPSCSSRSFSPLLPSSSSVFLLFILPSRSASTPYLNPPSCSSSLSSSLLSHLPSFPPDCCPLLLYPSPGSRPS